MAAMWESPELATRKVEELRAQAMEGPPPPTAAVIAKLEAIPYDVATGPDVPAWCHPVCRYREAFHCCAL
eukprot:14553975-Heterocapsa_arctica.AAC.1